MYDIEFRDTLLSMHLCTSNPFSHFGVFLLGLCVVQHFHQAPPLPSIVKSRFKIRFAGTVNRQSESKCMAPQHIVQNPSQRGIRGRGKGEGSASWKELVLLQASPSFISNESCEDFKMLASSERFPLQFNFTE